MSELSAKIFDEILELERKTQFDIKTMHHLACLLASCINRLSLCEYIYEEETSTKIYKILDIDGATGTEIKIIIPLSNYAEPTITVDGGYFTLDTFNKFLVRYRRYAMSKHNSISKIVDDLETILK